MRGTIRGSLVGFLLLTGLALGSPVVGQDTAALNEDPLFESLYPPELIMQHRRAIGLDDEQRDAISRLISDFQGRVISLQWELLDEMQQLGTVTRRSRVDLDEAMDEIGDVLDKEKDIKTAHLEMLVRIKNILRPDQQEMLDRFKVPPGGEG
ncbi:MAG: hypothetical protein AAF389_12185 [Gemmatimonadota bacterium]